MSWTDSGINWETPDTDTPIWPVCVEIAKAINERHRLSNTQFYTVNQYPLIAYDELDENPSATNSRGRRQYKMFQSANYAERPFVIGTNHPLKSIANALQNEFTWNFGRTDLANYTVDEMNPRTIKELSIYGFPQAWENANETAMSDIEWIESLYPACNNIISRIDNSDVSLFTAHGYLKKEIINELFEIMKAFKFMYFSRFRKLNGDNTGVLRDRVVNNEPAVSFNTVWAATADNVGFESNVFMSVLSQTGDLKTARCRNADIHNILGEHGFTTVPNLVTTPRYRLFQQLDGVPVESKGVGFYDMPTSIIDGTTLVANHWVTPDGQSPASLTLPTAPDDWVISSGTVTTGSGSTTDAFCFDLTTSGDLDYPVNGS